MDVDNASGESATFPCGHSGAKPTSMPETRCYQRVLDCAGIQSSALFRDAELVDNPKEVTCAFYFLLDVLIDPGRSPCQRSINASCICMSTIVAGEVCTRYTTFPSKFRPRHSE